jgi:hypothetical protein
LRIPGPTGFQRTEIGLAGAAFLAPFSATNLFGPLTLGRSAAIAFAVLLAADLLEERPRGLRFSPSMLLLGGAYVGLWAWMYVNAETVGCNCGGKAGGFTEFAFIGVLSLVAIGVAPRLRGIALISVLCGTVLAALMALAGFGSLNSGTIDLTQTGGRLSGTYGNANELGFAAALGIPIALAYRSLAGRIGQVVFGAAVLILSVTIVLSYSRGAVIAAAVGTLALLLWEARGSRWRLILILGVAGAGVLVAGILYAAFESERRDVSFVHVSPQLKVLDQRDLSGWDSRALGPIPRGPSRLSNQGESIAVRSSRSGEGASFRWGEGRAGTSYVLSLRAKSDEERIPFNYALGDADRPADRTGHARLGPGWRDLKLTWRPRSNSPHATLYLWQVGGPSRFSFQNVRVTSKGEEAAAIDVPDRLEGSIYDRLQSEARRSESRYIESRLDAADLAFHAFRSEPLVGIGWSTFPEYAAEHLDYGPLAVHNQYLAMMAELGIIGLALLVMAGVALALGLRQMTPGRPEAAALGLLAAAAAGFVFVEALPAPQLSVPIAIAAAVLCARLRRDSV